MEAPTPDTLQYILFIFICYYLIANGFSPGGSGTTVGQQTNNTHYYNKTKDK
jgi:hypothetical protein